MTLVSETTLSGIVDGASADYRLDKVRVCCASCAFCAGPMSKAAALLTARKHVTAHRHVVTMSWSRWQVVTPRQTGETRP